MNILSFAGILTLLLIWNSYALGRAWKDTMTLGTWGHKLCLWFGLYQNVAAFSILIFSGMYYAGAVFAGIELPLYPSGIGEFLEYFLIISVSAIALSARIFQILYARFDYKSLEDAGWTNYGKIHDKVTVIGALGHAFVSPKKFFSESVQELNHPMEKAGAILLTVVLFAVLAGFFAAFNLVRYFMTIKSARIEGHLRALQINRD